VCARFTFDHLSQVRRREDLPLYTTNNPDDFAGSPPVVRAQTTQPAYRRPRSGLSHWHDGNILYQGGTVSGILDFDFAHPDLPLVDVAIAALIPEVEDSAQIAVGYFGARSPTEQDLDLIATAQRARALGHVAFFIGRHVEGDHGALDQVRLGVDPLLRAEQRWPALRAAILRGTAG
jgi:Ser/Thr protein kinase RdoA (MazF antagonist)